MTSAERFEVLCYTNSLMTNYIHSILQPSILRQTALNFSVRSFWRLKLLHSTTPSKIKFKIHHGRPAAAFAIKSTVRYWCFWIVIHHWWDCLVWTK